MEQIPIFLEYERTTVTRMMGKKNFNIIIKIVFAKNFEKFLKLTRPVPNFVDHIIIYKYV